MRLRAQVVIFNTLLFLFVELQRPTAPKFKHILYISSSEPHWPGARWSCQPPVGGLPTSTLTWAFQPSGCIRIFKDKPSCVVVFYDFMILWIVYIIIFLQICDSCEFLFFCILYFCIFYFSRVLIFEVNF